MIHRRKKKLWNEMSWIIFGLLFQLIDGKFCPETVRQHSTRCDKYFRCVILSQQSYVWVPMQCERGLVFESKLKTCVLPDDDWECDLNDGTEIVKLNSDEKNIYGIKNIPSTMDYNDHVNDEDDSDDKISSSSENVNSVVNNISSTDEINKISEFNKNYQSTRKTEYIVHTTPKYQFATPDNDNAYDSEEFSGDGPLASFQIQLEEKNNPLVQIPESIDFDNSLTTHLQRLSQLVASVKKQKNHSTMEADELNSFLANFNIQSSHQNTDFDSPNKLTLTDDGKIHQHHLEEIINKQSTLTIQDVLSTLSTESAIESTTQMPSTQSLFPVKTPKVKLELNAESPIKRNRKPDSNIHSSQIIVNRPGGSVLFKLDPGNQVQAYQPVQNGPYISEETLRTVLALSKQMIENQNIQNSYPRPIVKPLYYTVPMPVLTNFNSQFSPQLNEDDVEISDPSLTKHVISGFMNNMPIRRRVTAPQSQHIPITVSNSFNTYKDYDTDPSKQNEQNVQQSYYPTNNISTTVIFDHLDPHNPANTYQYPPITTVTTTTTQAPAIVNKFYDSYGQPLSNEYYQNAYPNSYVKPPAVDSYFPINNHQQSSYFNSFAEPPYTSNQQFSNFQNNQKFADTPQSTNDFSQQNQQSAYENYQPVFQSYPNTQQSFYNGQQHVNPQPAPFNNPNKYYNSESLSNVPIYNRPSDSTQNTNTKTKPHTSNHSHSETSTMVDDDDDDDMEDNEEDSNETMEDNNESVTTHHKLTHNKKTENKRPSYTDMNSIQGNENNIYNTGQLQSSSLSTSPFLSLANSGYGSSSSSSSGGDTKNKLVNLGGHFVNYDSFKNSLFPFMQPNVEVVTCVSGARQPNTTDCTRYYVCNPKTKNVLGYTCPPYTAFNKDAKLCDARTYAYCKPEAIADRFTVAENIRAQLEAQKVVEDVNRLQAETIKAQALSQIHQLQQQTQNRFQVTQQQQYQQQPMVSEIAVELPSAMQPLNTNKKRIRCHDTGKIADPGSMYHYWVCFRNKDGRMKRQRMKCSGGLVFCSSMRLCTIEKRCMT